MEKSQEVTNFVRFLIALSGIYLIDDEDYVINKVSGERLMLDSNGKKRNVLIFKETILDNEAIVVNPLNETIGDSDDKKWLYSALSLGLSRRLKVMLNEIAVARTTNDAELSIPELETISKFKTEDIDEKFRDEELSILTKDLLIFSNVYYRKKFKESRWRCSLFENDTRETLKIRKKTWKSIDSIFTKIFDLDTMAIEEVNKKFSYTTSVISCPKLVSTLNVYNLIYTKLNAYLEVLGGGDEDAVVDLDELAYHLDNIESYYKRVKWFVSETSSKPEEKEPEFNPIAGTQFIDLKKNEEHYSETPEGVPIVFKRNNLFNAQPTLL